MPSSLDAIMCSTQDSQTRIQLKQPINIHVDTVEAAVRSSVDACHRQGVRCIISVGSNFNLRDEYDALISKRMGTRMKIVSADVGENAAEALQGCKHLYHQNMSNPHNICLITNFTAGDLQPFTRYPFQIVSFLPFSVDDALHLTNDCPVEDVVNKYNFWRQLIEDISYATKHVSTIHLRM